MSLSVDPGGVEQFAATNTAVAEMISAVGSADAAANLAAAAAALGPIGITYLVSYAPAQANNLAGTQLIGTTYGAIGAATDAAKASFIDTDNAST
ncbi:hypothetical protein BH11ACT6_BH11ACT6_35470 [soil metagenome]